MIERKATIKLVVDDRDVKRAETSVQRLERAGSNLNATDRFKAETDAMRRQAEAARNSRTANLDAASAVQEFAAQSDGLGASIGGAGAGLAAFTVLAGGTILVLTKITQLSIEATNAFIAFSKETERLSQTTGFSVEAVSALRNEAELTGRTFDDISGPLENFGKLVADAKNGSAEAQKTLRQFGLEGKTAALDIDQAFSKAAKQILETPDALKSSKLAVAAFGDEGNKAIPILQNFHGEISTATKRADELGVLLSTDGVNTARAYEEQLAVVQARLKGITYSLGQELAPVLEEVLSDFNGWLIENKGEIRSWADTIVQGFRNAIRWIEMTKTVISGGDVFGMKERWKVEDDSRDFESMVRSESKRLSSQNADFWKREGFANTTPLGSVPDSKKPGAGRLAKNGPDPFADERTKARFNSAMRKLSPALQSQIIRYAEIYGIPESLAMAQIFSESSFNTQAVSPFNKNVGSSAFGLTQQLPATASRMMGRKITGEMLKDDPELALTAWGRYMSKLFAEFGDWELATLAYHQGEGEVRKLVRLLDAGKSSEAFFNARPNGKAYVKKIAALSGIRGADQFNFAPVNAVARARMDGPVMFEPDQLSGAIAQRATMTPDQIEQFVTAAPNLIRSFENEIAGSGLSGAQADMALIEKIVEFKKQILGLDEKRKENEVKNLTLLEIEANQQAVIKQMVDAQNTSQKERLKDLELALDYQQQLFSDDKFRKQAEELKILEEKISLNQQIFDLEVALATQGSNAAERYKAAWLGAIYEVRQANVEAVEDQIRAQVRIADQSVLHLEQVRARVLDHFAEQKSISEALSDGIISAYDKLLGKMNESLGKVGDIPIVGDLLKFGQQQSVTRLFKGLMDLPGLGDLFDQGTKNPVAAPIVEQVKITNELLGQIVSMSGGTPVAGGGGIGGLLGRFGIGPGGTAPFNGGGGGFGGGFIPSPGPANAGAPKTLMQGLSDMFSTGPGGLFEARKNLLTGETSKLAGILGGAGDIASMIGGVVGGRAGSFLSNIGTGLSIGSNFGPWGAAIGAGIGLIASLFGGDPKKKQDKKENLPKLEAGFSEAMKQLRDLLSSVRSGTDPDAAIAQAAQIRTQIAGGFGVQFLSKKYQAQSRTMIAARLTEADAIIEQIKQAAEVSRGAADRRDRIVAEFAGGVFLDPAFRRRNGMLGGVFTGRDSLPSLLSPGELVLNPTQMHRVRANAGFDVFKGAGIPNYPNAAPTAALAGGGVAGTALAMNDQPINVTVVLSGDVFDERVSAFVTSDSGTRVVVKTLKDLRKENQL